MSDRTYAKAQAQQKTLTGSSPKSSLLQRTCACGQHTIAGGECSTCRNKQPTLLRSQRAFEPSSASVTAQENVLSLNTVVDRVSSFGHNFSRIPVYASRPSVLQTKLKVNQPGDAYEQEADRVAGQVMRMIDSEAPVSEDEERTEKSLMRKQSREPQADASAISNVPPLVHDVLNGRGGQPLDTTTRAFMEPRFGHDFSHVRVHTDERAAKSARSINALAYTVGNDIIFGASRYAPDTTIGQRLLAHELTHAIQQSTHGLAVQRQQAVQPQTGGYSKVDLEHWPKSLRGPTEFPGLLSEGYYRWLEIEPGGGLVETGNSPIGGSSRGKILGGDVLHTAYLDTSEKRLVIVRQYLQVQTPAQEIKNYYLEVWWKIHDDFEFKVISNFARLAESGQPHATALLVRPFLGNSGLWQIAKQEAIATAVSATIDLGAGLVIRRITRPPGGKVVVPAKAVKAEAKGKEAEVVAEPEPAAVKPEAKAEPKALPPHVEPKALPPRVRSEPQPTAQGKSTSTSTPGTMPQSWADLEQSAEAPTPRRPTGTYRSQSARSGNREVIIVEGEVRPPVADEKLVAKARASKPTLPGEHATHAVGAQLGENLPEAIVSGPASELNLSALKRVENATRATFDKALSHGATVETQTTLHVEHRVVQGEKIPVVVGVKRQAWLRVPGSDKSIPFIDFEARIDSVSRQVTIVRNKILSP
jgi:hypothetical protein